MLSEPGRETYRNQEDEELLEGCLRHDRRCQQMLYQRFAPKMYSICLSYAPNRAEAKDILQDGFIKVFNNIKGFKKGSSLEGWIRKIITNTAIDHYRHHARLEESTETKLANEYLMIPESTLEQIGYNQMIDIMNRLPDGARIIFNLHVLEGYTHKEIAKMLEISEGTSKSQLNRAKSLLKKMITG